MTNNESPNPPAQIPVRTCVVCAYVIRKKTGKVQFLVLRRKSRYMFGLWQQVAGRIEQGENAVQAIIREIKEETGLVPDRLYSADYVESFYEANHHCIHFIPVFVAIADSAAEVILSGEHSEFKWLSAAQAKKHLTFVQQRNSIDIIYKEFALKKPPAELRITL